MRISYKAFPSWEIIENPDRILELEVDQAVGDYVTKNSRHTEKGLELIMTFLTGIKYVAKQIKKKWIVSETFQAAITKALPKLQNKTEEIFNSISDVGVLFTKDGFTLYFVNPPDQHQSGVKVLLYGFTREALTSFAFFTTDGNLGGSYMINGKEEPDLLKQWLVSVLQVLFFIKNCEIETKELQPGQKLKVPHSGERYLNETTSNFITLDVTWFTKLISKLDITVPGYLRWQVHGPRNSLRKIIWIDDYTYKLEREAKKNKILKGDEGI